MTKRLLNTKSIPLPKIQRRRTLIASALILQGLVLVVAWVVTFRTVRGELALAVQDYIVRENSELVEDLANRFPMDGSDPSAFESEEWDQWQQVIEEAATDLPAGGFACLLDGDGHVLCHPDIREDRYLRRVNLGKKLIESATPGGEQVQLDRLAADETFSGRVSFVADGTHYVATRKVPGTDLRLLVHQPEAELFRAGDEVTSSIVASAATAAIAVLLLSGGGLMLVVRSYDSVFESVNRRLRSNLQLARDIQQATFPQTLPVVKGFELAAWSEPAEETGGDTFDVIGLRSPRDSGAPSEPGESEAALVALADATGHGVGPALAATAFRSLLRMAARSDQSVQEMVSRINEQMYADLPAGRFVTGWVARLDGETGEIESCAAGQGPILIYRASDAQIERLPTDTVPIGVLESIDFESAGRIALEPGDTVAAISDGIFEALGPAGEAFGIERVEHAIVSSASGDADSIMNAIREALAAFTGSAPADDDRTVVIVKRSPR